MQLILKVIRECQSIARPENLLANLIAIPSAAENHRNSCVLSSLLLASLAVHLDEILPLPETPWEEKALGVHLILKFAKKL